MLSFAAIMPHPPILMPTIGKENKDKLEKTISALQLLEKQFEQEKPQTVIVISPHGDIYPDAFTINMMPEYEGNLNDFGDFETKFTYQSDVQFIHRFKEQVESKMALNLKSEPHLDYASTIPLYYLSQRHKNFKIVPINYSLLSYEKHLEFGRELKEMIMKQDEKIAVIASADLSHRLSKNAPGGFSPNAKNFDKEIIKILKQKKTDLLLNIDKNLIEDADQCGLRSILILQGIVENISYDFQVLSYESPFGVGHLVGEYIFS